MRFLRHHIFKDNHVLPQKKKKKKTHKNQTYKIKILQAWESQTSISNRLKVIKMLHGSRHFEAHGDNGGKQFKEK